MSSDADVLSAVNVPRFPDGGVVSLAAIFGNSITFDDGIHLVTVHYVLSPETQGREKAQWLGLSWGLLVMQMVAAGAIMAGAVVPNCTGNSHCREGQYCCPR